MYRYVGNEPTGKTDPSGMEERIPLFPVPDDYPLANPFGTVTYDQWLAEESRLPNAYYASGEQRTSFRQYMKGYIALRNELHASQCNSILQQQLDAGRPSISQAVVGENVFSTPDDVMMHRVQQRIDEAGVFEAALARWLIPADANPCPLNMENYLAIMGGFAGGIPIQTLPEPYEALPQRATSGAPLDVSRAAQIRGGVGETFGRITAGGFSPPRIYTNRYGQLTNGVHRLDDTGMAAHISGSLAGGKSQFLFRVNEKQLVLDAAAFADEAGLWVGNKAKLTLDRPIGVHGTSGELTNVLNIYRNNSNFIHGAPGAPQ